MLNFVAAQLFEAPTAGNMAASGAGSQSGNTVFLEPQNRIVEDFVTKFFSEDAPTKDTHLVVGDFDGA